MAIVYLSNGTNTRLTTTWIGNVAAHAGADLLVVAAIQYGNTSWGTVQYGGDNLSVVNTIPYNNYSQQVNGIGMWFKLNPKSGTNQLRIPGGPSQWIYPRWIWYKGVESYEGQTSTVGYTQSSQLELFHTTTAENAWLIGHFGLGSGAPTITGINGTVLRNTGTNGNQRSADRNGGLSPPGSYALTWDMNTSLWRIGIAASFAPKVKSRRQVLTTQGK